MKFRTYHIEKLCGKLFKNKELIKPMNKKLNIFDPSSTGKNLFEINYWKRKILNHNTNLKILENNLYSWFPEHFDEHPINMLGREACKLSKEGKYIESNEKFTKSLGILLKTTKDIKILNEYHKGTLNNIGWNYLQMGASDKAIEILEKAKKIDFQMHFVNNNLGTSYEHKGNLNKAKQFYRAELECNPKHPTAKQSLEKLCQI